MNKEAMMSIESDTPEKPYERPYNRPWLPYYIEGVRADLPHAPYRTLGEAISSTARKQPHAPAFTVVMPNGMNGSLTYGQVDEMSDAFAVYLRDVLGLKAGDRVALQVPNSLPFPIAAFGVFKAGCVLVNVNPLYTGEEMGKQFADAKPAALIIIDLFAHKIPEAFSHFPVPHVIITRIAEFLPFWSRTLIGMVQRYKDKTVQPLEANHVAFASAINEGRKSLQKGTLMVESYTSTLEPNALACLQYTGGTTGVSKGAMLSHANIIINMAQAIEMIGNNVTRGKEVVLTALPLYHIFAFTVNLFGFWWIGAHNVLVPSPRPITNVRKAFERYPITWMTGVNTLFNALLNERWFVNAPPQHLKASVAGGMALHSAVADRWQEVTKTPVIEGYGLTEASPVVTFNPFGRAKRDSIGIPLPSTLVRCVDEGGSDVPQGDSGELVVKGPQVMLGYWQREGESAHVMRDGWLLTGDIAVMDQEGYLKIVDRKKDLIVVSGFKVFPNEVEECLARHPDVVESAVIGIPDETTGEAVKAFVVSRNPALTAENIKAHCKKHMTGYKIPKVVVFKDELPKSPVGKILRRLLRDEA
jgi:long-chain acyl-CoA synthetase